MDKQMSLDERIRLFNTESDTRYLEEILRNDREKEEELWEAYSSEQIQKMFSLTEDEALKLLKSGLFKIYRAGNEYRASKKSVEENQQIVKTMINLSKKYKEISIKKKIVKLRKDRES